MRDILFPFQETALAELHDKINKAHLMWSERDPQIISFSAPTGSGKTIIMTTLFEDILYGSADSIGEPDSVFIWLSDSPELNEQTRLKIESKSDKIRVRDLVTIESTFNTEYFEGGCIYFLNTQNLAYTDVFDAMDNLITYRIDSVRKQAPLKLLIQISRALTMDGIDLEAQKTIKNAVLLKMHEEITRIKESGDFENRVAAITGFELGTLTFDYGDNAYSFDESSQTMTVSEFDISRHFEQSGKLLGEGLHKEYWIRNSTRDHIDVKVEIIVLTNDTNAMERINDFAEEEFITLYENNKRAIAKLNEARKNVYERLINASAQPIAVPWVLPDSIDFYLPDDRIKFEQHLYCAEDGTFQTSLNKWESGVIDEELKNGAICWLRNLDRKKWSLEIPYEVNGVTTSMFPDLVVVRADTEGYVFDILEPHDPSRKDNYPKAVGLAKFAEKHWDKFGRIQLIRLKKGVDGRDHFYRLDMGKTTVRNKVRGIISNEELDRIFDTDAERED